MKLAAHGAVVLALALAAPSGAAQQVSLRLGGVHASYANTVSGSAATAAARLTWDAPRYVAAFGGSYARFSSGWWASQMAGSFYGMRLVGPRTGLGVRGDGEAGILSDGAWSGTLAAGPVASLLAGNSVLSAALALGALHRVDSMASATIAASFRARTDLGPWTIEGTLESTHARRIDLTDATAEVAYSAGPLSISALAGGRAGDLGGKPWLQGRVEFGAAPWATLEIQGGSYPRDISGFTSGSFLSVGVWLRPWRRSTGTGVPSLAHAASGGGATIESIEPGRARVTVIVPGARQVAIAGEWNEWTPTAMVRLDRERWQANVALGKGAHRFSLLVDGSRWVVPAGVPSLPDSFGGTVGLLVVDE